MGHVYSNLKFLAYGDRLQALREGRLTAPVHVRIKPINLCNHNCWYCAYRADTLQLGEAMDLRDKIPEDKIFEIADDLVAMGVKAVTFSGGGEPLLYKPLPAVVERLAAGGIRVATLTNGANLKGAMAEAFARHGTWVRVSLDAWDDASYQRSRGARDGDYTKLMDNMAAFTATGTACVLGVSFIVDEHNHPHLPAVCERLREIGVDHVKVSGVVVANDMAENNAYHRRIADQVAQSIKTAKRLETGRFRVVNHYHELEERFDKPYHSCPFLQFLTVIGADSQVYTCQDKAYTAKGTLGSLKGRSFRDFWLSDENLARVRGIDPGRDCRHHCVAHGKNLVLHDILGLDPDHGAFV